MHTEIIQEKTLIMLKKKSTKTQIQNFIFNKHIISKIKFIYKNKCLINHYMTNSISNNNNF
jgi:hypothetical protein